MDKGILSAKELANYIKHYYFDKFSGKNISPLKLQKSLYFCFAYWGGFIFKNKDVSLDKKEIELNYPPYLFSEKIEAWAYGPVVPDVYHESNLDSFDNNHIFDDKEYVQKFIDNILDDILPLNDFKLVEISHEDQCWKKHFNKSNVFHNVEIPKDEIIKEYAKIC